MKWLLQESFGFENRRVKGYFLKDELFHYTKRYTPINRRCNLLKS
ncbi:hypothetical protein D521_1617 [beta proteobacterium CB]|nr:hypothetical protein D521_1617 [beta proteobacterium CB]